MKIKRVRIANWRSIKSLDIGVTDLTILIGQNNHGKSNILSALLFFFGESKHQDLDFNRGSQELSVEITFDRLDDADKTTFKKYLNADGEITVRKTAYLGGSFDYRGYIQNPEDEWLQEARASSYTRREVAEVLPFHPFLPASGRLSRQDILDAQVKFTEANKAQIRFSRQLEETNFLGLKSVAKGIFGDVYFIPAIKDASDEFSSKEASAFGKLYSKVIDRMSVGNADWRDTKDKLISLFSSLNRTDSEGRDNVNRPQELRAFEEALSQELLSWGAEIDVEVTPPKIDEVFRANTQVWINDGVRTDIRRKGHGLQRALTFALIKVISDWSKLEREEEAKSGSRTASSSTFFILEEPELYLHPQAQRALLDSLVGLSESGCQVLLCTHASALIDVERYKSICIVRKQDDAVGTEVCQCHDELFTGDSHKDFNLSYWINPDRSELFFARRVILVEGATDKTTIPLIAKKIGVFRYDYTVVDCGSKTAIPLYVRLLNRFAIPYVVVYDRDHQVSKNQQAKDVADRDSKLIEDEIDENLGCSVVFENDIEEELGLPPGGKSKPYVALVHVESDQFQLSNSLEIKIRGIYGEAGDNKPNNGIESTALHATAHA